MEGVRRKTSREELAGFSNKMLLCVQVYFYFVDKEQL